MAALFEPARHVPLNARAWDESAVRAWIDAFARDADAANADDRGWATHPGDRADDDGSVPYTPVYHGDAGVVWTLDSLAAGGFAVHARDRRAALPALLARNLVEVQQSKWGDESLMLGQGGVLLLAWRLSPSDEDAERVGASAARNAGHPSNELLWGVPGSLHALAALYEHTGDARWARAWVDAARSVIAKLHDVPDAGCALWTQDLYGERTRYLGAGHGFAGTAGALVRGEHLLDADERMAMRERIVDGMLRTAVRSDGFVNWPPLQDHPTSKWLVQWCHGAPGVITSLAALDDRRLDDVLLEAGELVWRAGPLAKGPGLCHGTAGNGFAFLKLHQRTRDDRWLDAARRFAMHAIRQSDVAAAAHGARRWSLWTGDAGVALFAAACLDGSAVMPPLDPEPIHDGAMRS